jgi:hypothetical protein
MSEIIKLDWHGEETMHPKSYRCGYCSKALSSEKGYYATTQMMSGNIGWIYICHFCHKPTFFDYYNNQTPGETLGNPVAGIAEENVSKLYEEARECTSISAYTSAVLACRKLLMHVAVDLGAKKGLNFIEYVEYLSEKGYIPPGAKEWVDIIRKKGNEANHEILIMTEEDAKDLLKFTEMLLKIIYEFPDDVKRRADDKDQE